MDMELQCMQLITKVGSAKSLFIMAIAEAKKGDFVKAEAYIAEGETYFEEGHHAHFELFNAEFKEKFSQEHFLIMHAEDQLMAADTFKIIALEFIDLYKKLAK